MTWQTPEILRLAKEAKDLVEKEVGVEETASVFIASEGEMTNATLQEQTELGRTPEEIERIRFDLQFILGKYFPLSNEIWLVEGRGVILDVIIHEMIHSMQRCSLHREGIVDYVTFKITGNRDYVAESVLEEWQEIERSVGYKAIRRRLLSGGDCEEF